MLTMLLGGLWHGANWTFVVWGGLHGAALCAHKYFLKRVSRKAKPRPPKRFAATLHFIAAITGTNIFVCFCWIFFRAESFSAACNIIAAVLTWQDGIIQPYIWTFIAFGLLIAAFITAIVKHGKNSGRGQVDGFYPVLDLSKFWHLTLFLVFIGLTVGLAFTGENPFIYFQF
jgi:alginate O-acetyltransferase complex protein AlgI